MGDNGSQLAPMNFEEETTVRSPEHLAQVIGLRARPIARKVLLRIAPSYMRRRWRDAITASEHARLRDEFEHLQERHGEQIERLEDVARELILSTDALRARIATAEKRLTSERGALAGAEPEDGRGS